MTFCLEEFADDNVNKRLLRGRLVYHAGFQAGIMTTCLNKLCPNMSGEFGFTHVDASGAANMVDVSEKSTTARRATAAAKIVMQPETLKAIENDDLIKGEVLAVARVAGIQAAKKCSDLIPLCHPLALSKVSISFEHLNDCTLGIQAECRLKGQTGVEMEALTAVSVAALTVYDMCKAIDKGMVITDLGLVEKQGGKSGSWSADASSVVRT